jgi:putative nucleotidyltransferase with HDIG domain
MSLRLKAFIAAVVGAGAAVIAHSVAHFDPSSMTLYLGILCVLTIATGRFAIKVPGQPATVSVSELFVFASILLAGPAIPVLTVAVDGLLTSFRQRHRRWYRAAFNVAEPAISAWVAAQVFFFIIRVPPGSPLPTHAAVLVSATVGMAGAFFALNSGLNAIAVALENGTSAFVAWRTHAWYLAINYDAAASLATLAVTGQSINFAVVGLAAPLLILSYVAYREASVRAQQGRAHTESVERLYRASVEMLAIAVDAKDQITHGHIRRVQRHTLAVARAVGVTDVRELKAIETGALLHDIGKLAVPDHVLNKPSKLTAAEFDTMKKHATMGARILNAVDFPYPIVPIVRHHHEQWDGGGYPDGLAGAEIPLGARILAVVDCFDALTSDRPYRSKLTETQAIDILRSRKGSFYDPVIVDQFIALVAELRRDDETAHEHTDVHASVVASLVQPANSSTDAVAAFDGITFPRSVSDRIDDFARANVGSQVCVFAANKAGDTLTIAYATPGIAEAVAALRVAVGSGVSGWVAANRSTIRSAEAALDLADLAEQFNLSVCTSVPLFVCGDLIGVVTAYAEAAPNAEEHAAAVGLLTQELGLTIARHRQSLRASAPMSFAAAC